METAGRTVRILSVALSVLLALARSPLRAQEKPIVARPPATREAAKAQPYPKPTEIAVNLPDLRRAIDDLIRSFPDTYRKGNEYGVRLTAIERRLGPNASGSTLDPQAVALRDEALRANPLLDFDRLLLVRRRDGATLAKTNLAMPFVNDPVGHRHGLPSNFQGNSVLREFPFDNEIAVLSPVHSRGKLTRLYKPFRPGFVGDVDLHFDATRCLFSSIGAHNRWQVFEIGIDGSHLRQVSPGEADDVDNYDACYLPDGRIVFSSSACFQSVPCERRLDETANLFVMNADGSGVRRLCFDQDHNFCPTVLPDGRVLYLRWEYADIAHAFSGRLFSMNPDGTQQRAHYASSSFWPNRIFYARPVPGHPTRFVGIVSGHHGTARAGELILFDTARGQRLADGVVQRIPGFGRPVEPRLVDNLVDAAWPRFLHPFPLSDKYFLVACQPRQNAPWGIYLVDVFDNLLLLHEEPGQVLFEPIPIRTSPVPPIIADRTKPQSKDATVYVADVYAGEGLTGVPRGTVRQLRLFTYHFNYYGTSALGDPVGADGPWDIRRIMGTVPVAPDGSAYFRVPANTPIAVQPLDAEGKALQWMRSWFTAMPGENVSCIGCHERERSTPAPPLAAPQRPAASIAPWYGPMRGFSFSREVQPVLDRYCVGCHNEKSPMDLRAGPPVQFTANAQQSAARFPLSFWHLRRYVRSPGLEGDPRVLPVADYHADANLLTQLLRGGHYGVRLDAEAWDRLATWMDLNAPAYGTWLEMPSVGDRRDAVAQCVARRKDSLERFAGLTDEPELLPAAATEKVAPILPPTQPPAAPIQVEGWPFVPEKAAQLRAAAGARSPWRLPLAENVALVMTLVPAGEFAMGDPAGADNERAPRRVRIERPFWLGQVEITNAQFRCFDPTHTSGREPILGLKWTPSDFWDLSRPDQPVCRVSWERATAFCRWLSERTGKPFRLPTEEEWEWACRAGSGTPLSFGTAGADYKTSANLADVSLLKLFNSELMPPFLLIDAAVNDGQVVAAPVGSFRPNAWGLYDMHGNVAEWTASADPSFPGLAASASDNRTGADPTLHQGGPPVNDTRNTHRIVRGGSWSDPARFARSARRISYPAWQAVYNVGFRVACTQVEGSRQ